jgi:hypothetical protein
MRRLDIHIPQVLQAQPLDKRGRQSEQRGSGINQDALDCFLANLRWIEFSVPGFQRVQSVRHRDRRAHLSHVTLSALRARAYHTRLHRGSIRAARLDE